MASQEYRIRLPKPWQLVTSRASESGGQTTTHEFQRSFQCPTGLQDSSLLELEVRTSVDMRHLQRIACSLNGQPLEAGSTSPSRFPMARHLLQSTNRLTVQLTCLGDQPDATLPEVAILIT